MEGGHSLLERLLRDKNAEPKDMPISLLKSITNNFADAQKIGCGGFAVVYKGLLKNGAIVAVKKLSNSIFMDENKYNQEVSCLMRVKHRNVVRFLGYCADTQGKMLDYGGKFVMADMRERLLCFEYVPNGTLKDYITDASDGLEWRKCYQIIKGICEGLHYLHEMRIVHLDLKPANILLDDNMVPKIADFGISRCFDQEQSWTIATTLVGTPGYLAPESYTRKITSKLDMYSLGVIIIEILTGQKGYSSVENVLESWRNRLKTSSAIDTVLQQIRVCCEISIDCMDFNPEKRPTTRRIIELLEQTRMDEFNETDVQKSNPTTSCKIRDTTETPQVKFEFQEARKRDNGGANNSKSQGSAPLKYVASKKTAWFGDDEMPPTSNAGSTKGLVTIKPVKYFKDDAALTADMVTAEVEINATSSTTMREGLDLVAVLDVSSSMAGEKIESVKKAMVFVIMKLTPMDRLSIVIFSNGATRLSPLLSMTPAAQNNLKALIDGLWASLWAKGRTNIQAGLEIGLAMIADRVNTKARTANIFLMSDGRPTSGDARQVVVPGQVAIYTFGFGRDTHHQMMSDIAKKSPGGTFSSVPDGSKVSLPFSQLLGGLLTVVAQDLELTITPMTKEGDVDTILVAPGTDYTQTTDAATGVITLKFGTLFAGEGRRVIINLTLKDVTATFSEEYEAPLAEVQHSYTAQGRPKDPQLPRDIQTKRTPTPSQAPGASSKARQVQAEIARRNHAEVIRQARLLADKSDLDEARYKLVDAQNALEDIVQDGLANGQKLVNSLRTELVQLIKLMETKELYAAQGRPYALASETSHGRQRYCARGGDEDSDVRLFTTARMDTYLEQAKNFEKDPVAPVPSAADEM